MKSKDDSYPDKDSGFDFIYEDYDLSTIFTNKSISIHIFRHDILFKSALLVGAGGTGIFSEKSVIIQNSKLFVCLTNNLFCINLPDLSLVWDTTIEWSNCYQIFALNGDFVIHGEQTISRVNEKGFVIWQFKGDDIFVNSNGEFTFEVCKNKIRTSDYQGNFYELDFEGQLLLKLP